MRTLTLILATGLVIAPATAQEWNAEQQGLIDHVRNCWNVWVEALADETPARFLEACATDERGHWWDTTHGAPEALVSGIRRNWHIIRETDEDWADLRPIYVDIFGDVGIMHLYGYWRANTPDGTVTTEMKRTEVFQRRNGVWTLIGAQSAPVTPADAAPYRR